MNALLLFQRYQELQRYVGWSQADLYLVRAVSGFIKPFLPNLVTDFYDEIDRHQATRQVFTGQPEQVQRLKATLLQWLTELFSGVYDQAYVERRWRVGMRHVEIGLEQVYTNVSLSRIRLGLCQALEQGWIGPEAELFATCRAVHRLLDLDLAIIEDAYHSVYVDRLQRHERLAALGQIAAGIAHELRNPLNVLKTSTYYLLQAKSAPTEKVTEHLRRLDKHIELADNVISALSNFAKMPVPNLKAFELKRCLCEALEQTPMPDNIAVICDSLDALPPVLGDVDQVRIVFTNLLRNAREALGQGGSVHIPSRREQTHVVVAIRDTGPGIPPEILSRVMEPLFTTKARGLGLGLAIAKAILEKHQGSLQVESRLGEGTTFTVRMLADPSAAASLAEGESLGGALGSENPDCGR